MLTEVRYQRLLRLVESSELRLFQSWEESDWYDAGKVQALERFAADPTTSPAILKAFLVLESPGLSVKNWEASEGALDSYRRVMAAVAGNPNAPPEVLKDLARDGYLDAVHSNPALFMHTLENPAFTSELLASLMPITWMMRERSPALQQMMGGVKEHLTFQKASHEHIAWGDGGGPISMGFRLPRTYTVFTSGWVGVTSGTIAPQNPRYRHTNRTERFEDDDADFYFPDATTAGREMYRDRHWFDAKLLQDMRDFSDQHWNDRRLAQLRQAAKGH